MIGSLTTLKGNMMETHFLTPHDDPRKSTVKLRLYDGGNGRFVGSIECEAQELTNVTEYAYPSKHLTVSLRTSGSVSVHGDDRLRSILLRLIADCLTLNANEKGE